MAYGAHWSDEELMQIKIVVKNIVFEDAQI
jgi:hypothetical protein